MNHKLTNLPDLWFLSPVIFFGLCFVSYPSLSKNEICVLIQSFPFSKTPGLDVPSELFKSNLDQCLNILFIILMEVNRIGLLERFCYAAYI